MAKTPVQTPKSPAPPAPTALQAEQARDTQKMAAAMPYNPNKAAEIGRENATTPPKGAQVKAPSQDVGASTLSETNDSDKVGNGEPPVGLNRAAGTLDAVRVDNSGQTLTTNQGVAVSDNQNSLKAGLRGPTLLEDHFLREKITSFDHERIPERVVHARGTAAHGYFESYEELTDLTRAAPFAKVGKRTPVFTRFSTVAGERGSMDTARDVRGFAVKFYTDEGIWDLVGNNIPVFFIQDALKFPDLIHSVKPEPNNQIPQAQSAHDTFWDFASLSPETTHTLMWVMSDRGIPRSYRMMQGFGVHTFRLVNSQGKSVFVKFHWQPLQGTHSLVWDEALKIAGADPDFHRRDLWDAIEAGEYPEWELALQVFTEEQAEGFSFDVLDATKIVPEELVPLRTVGKMVLNRNPDNYFAETEQVAFCTSHVVPGIDFSNDPLLQGRNHSYLDTQISRLGGPNFHELPINASLAPVHNNSRDGQHRMTIPRGRVAYEPNSLAGGCPFQAGAAGFVSFPQPVEGDKVRAKPQKFGEHYAQATLFYDSLTPTEQAHTAGGFRFELSKLTVPAIRTRMLSSLVNVSPELASKVADGLGMAVPKAMPRAIEQADAPEVTHSPALSLMANPGQVGVRTRKVAILVADGVAGKPLRAVQDALRKAGAVPFVVGPRIGMLACEDGEEVAIEGSLENSPPVVFDGMVLADGEKSVATLRTHGQTREFMVNQYRHGKTMLALGAAQALFETTMIPTELPSGEADPGIVLAEGSEVETAMATFIEALSRHRHPERETDPPRV
ncbi:MAG: catalase [Rubrivivax sp.]